MALLGVKLADIMQAMREGATFGFSYPEAMFLYFKQSMADEEMNLEDEWSLQGSSSSGVLIDPMGEPLNFFHEDLNIPKMLEDPMIYPDGLVIGSENVPFTSYPVADDERVMPSKFFYTTAGERFIERLPKKKRDNFKTSLKRTSSVKGTVRTDGNYQNVSDVYKDRALSGDYAYLVSMFTAVLSGIDPNDLKVIEIEDSKTSEVLGGFVFVRAKRVSFPKPVWYGLIASFVIDVLYPAHQFIAENCFEPGEIFHYGVDDYFEEDMRTRFSYKRNIATDHVTSAYAAILPPRIKPPYFCQREKKWILS